MKCLFKKKKKENQLLNLLETLHIQEGRGKRRELSKVREEDFSGGPVLKIPGFHCRGAWVQSLFRELRSHMPSSAAKKKKESEEYL